MKRVGEPEPTVISGKRQKPPPVFRNTVNFLAKRIFSYKCMVPTFPKIPPPFSLFYGFTNARYSMKCLSRFFSSLLPPTFLLFISSEESFPIVRESARIAVIPCHVRETSLFCSWLASGLQNEGGREA